MDRSRMLLLFKKPFLFGPMHHIGPETDVSSELLVFFKLGFTSYKAEQPLQGMELQKKEAQKD